MMTTSDSEPPGASLGENRAWRYRVLKTVRELRWSIERHRTISLPNLCRIFDRRWSRVEMSAEAAERGRLLGREFLRQYYIEHQPLRAPPRRRGSCDALQKPGKWPSR